MAEERKELCEKISEIIKEYRSGEIDIQLNTAHVEKWVSQFSEDCQMIILSEMLHILSTWYYPKSKIVDLFLVQIENLLTKKYEYSTDQEMLEEVAFVSAQDVGNSQKQLINMMRELVDEQYMASINVDNGGEYQHYVYLDDGLYSGSRARKDIGLLLQRLPQNSTLDVFYLVAGTQNFAYTMSVLKKSAEENGIVFSMYRVFSLCNDHRRRSEDGEREEYESKQICLWPLESLEEIPEVKSYQESLTLSDRQKYYLYRHAPWIYDSGIFTSVTNRNIVEKEFLLKGIDIVNSIDDAKGMRPLGYDYHSFGYGSVCATEMNISNTCPLVLWWGINWYPLLPRRTNDVTMDQVIIEFEDEVNTSISDQYNMCPDCGNYFGFETDGGNGFCINCAWNH